jgi:hypothetical protein
VAADLPLLSRTEIDKTNNTRMSYPPHNRHLTKSLVQGNEDTTFMVRPNQDFFVPRIL